MRAMKRAAVAAMVAVVILAGGSVVPVGARGTTEVIALHVSGMADGEPTEPGRVAYTVNVYNITTGEQLGTLHDTITCSSTPPPCLVFDVVTTLRLRGGEIMNHASRGGARSAAARVPAGREPPAGQDRHGDGGRLRQPGGVLGRIGHGEIRNFPAQLGYDIFSVVTVDVARN